MAASYLAEHTLKVVAKQLQKMDDETLELLGSVAIRAAAVIEPVGVAIGRIGNHLHSEDVDGSFDDSDSDREVEVEGFDSKGHHKDLAEIQPFLSMAMAAYEDKSMADEFHFVSKSRLIKDLSKPTVLSAGAAETATITTDTEVHVCLLKDDSLAFAFRGTEILDWKDLKSLLGDVMTNLMKDLIPVQLHDASDLFAYCAPPSIRAHEGFQIAFRDITQTSRPHENIRLVAEGLGAYAPNVRRVICMGHSLGGALATLCAQWCRYVAYPKAQVWCVTIGSPRVGNKAFAEDFNKNVVTKGRSYRVVNKGDLIPNVPRFSGVVNVLSRYRHVDGFIHLSEHPSNKDVIILRRGGRRPSFHARSLKDHHWTSYGDSITRALSHLHHDHSLLPP